MRKNKVIVIMAVLAMICDMAPAMEPQPIEAPNYVNPLLAIPAVRQVNWPSKDEGSAFSERIYIVSGTTQVIRLDRPVRRITVSNNAIVDIRMLGPSEILINAKEAGRVNVIIWDEFNITATLDVQSVIDIKMLSQVINNIAPESNLDVVPYRDSVAVVGDVETLKQVEQIEQAVLAVAGQDSYSFVKVREPKQVLLEVRFAEVDRTAAEEFGFDGALFKRYWLFEIFTGRNAPSRTDDTTITQTVEGAATSIFPFLETPKNDVNLALKQITQSSDVDAYLQALVTKSILKLIARPNLLARDGEEARFVVGGEIPYVTSNNNSTNVEYKEFGTRLVFTPTFLANGKIRLEAVTSVSELDFNTTISIQGTSAPTIIKTEHKTVAELKDGQSLVVGGLMTQRITKTDRKVPVLGDIPLISKLFRDESFSRKDVELLLVITPRIVEPYDSQRRPEPFPPVVVEKAVQVSYPAFPEEQADLINVMLTQDENRPSFEKEELNSAVDVTKDIGKKILDIHRFGSFLGLHDDHTDVHKKIQNEKKQAKYVEVLYEAELADRQDSNTWVESAPVIEESQSWTNAVETSTEGVTWESEATGESQGEEMAMTEEPYAMDVIENASQGDALPVSEPVYEEPAEFEALYEDESEYDEDDLIRELSAMNGDDKYENTLPEGF